MKDKHSIAQCKLLAFDVDGCLTDSRYFTSDKGDIFKAFHTRDVWAIEQLLKKGYFVSLVTQGKDTCAYEKFHWAFGDKYKDHFTITMDM